MCKYFQSHWEKAYIPSMFTTHCSSIYMLSEDEKHLKTRFLKSQKTFILNEQLFKQTNVTVVVLHSQ